METAVTLFLVSVPAVIGGVVAVSTLATLAGMGVLGGSIYGIVKATQKKDGRDITLGNLAVKLDFPSCDAPQCVTAEEFMREGLVLRFGGEEEVGCRYNWAGTERGGVCNGIKFVNGTVQVEMGMYGWFEGEGPKEGQMLKVNWTTVLNEEEKVRYEEALQSRDYLDVVERALEGLNLTEKSS